MTEIKIHDAVLEAFLSDPNGPVGDILEDKGNNVLAAAELHVPVDTGELRESLHRTEAHVDRKGLVVRVGSEEPYALRVEMGFVGYDSLGRFYNQGPQPYLRPAVRGINGDVVSLSNEEEAYHARYREARAARRAAREARLS